MSHARTIVTVAAACALASCGSDPIAELLQPTIVFERGHGQSDTVLATPLQSFVVGVRNGGQPVPGVVVRFEAVSSPYSVNAPEPWVLVGEVDSPGFGPFASATTNANGSASVLIMMGTLAGTGRIAISVPDLSLQDTAQFTILPGAAAGVRVLPGDTALYVGNSARFQGRVVDRFGNPRTETATLSTSSAAITLSPTGTVQAMTFGRAAVIAQNGVWLDTGWVSVIPQGTLAVVRGDSLCTVNLDGSQLHCLAQVSCAYGGCGPVWSAAGTEIAYGSAAQGVSRIYAVSLAGSVRRLVPAPPATLVEEVWPSFGSGGVVYFGGRPSPENFGLWRVAADGSGPQSLLPVTGYDLMWRPSPSPDGTRLAFVVPDPAGSAIRVLTLANSGVSAWSVPGQTPRWSPDGTRIAFIAPYQGPVWVMNPDGTGAHVVAPGPYLDAGASWSPDRNWLVARSFTSLELVNVTSGLVLPLGFTGAFTEAAWKP